MKSRILSIVFALAMLVPVLNITSLTVFAAGTATEPTEEDLAYFYSYTYVDEYGGTEILEFNGYEDEYIPVTAENAYGYKVELKYDFQNAVNANPQKDFTGGNYTWVAGSPLPNPAPNGMYKGTKVTCLDNMFYYQTVLTSLDLSKFDTSNVELMGGLCGGCTNLKSIDLSTWDTSKVSFMTQMFCNCYKLNSIDISSFTLKEGVLLSNIFQDAGRDNSTVCVGYAKDADIVAIFNDPSKTNININKLKFEVAAPPMTGIEAANVTKTFDGNESGITVTGIPEDATLKYGTTAGTYELNASPKYTNAGTYTVYYKVTKGGFQDYTGSATVTINKKALTDAMIPTISSVTYNGNEQRPTVTLADGALLKNTDYTISYSNNIYAGTATVTATATPGGNYQGTASKNFTISKADGSLTITNLSDLSKIYDGGQIDSPLPDSSNVGMVYLEYKRKGEPDSAYSDAVRPIDAGTWIIRATAPEDNNHGQVVITEEITIAPREVIVTVDNATKVYGDNDPAEFTYMVNGGIELHDIVVTRAQGEDVGKYEITVSDPNQANPNYKIIADKGELEILKKNVTEANAVVTLGKALAENGKEQTQEVKSVKVGGKEQTFTVSNNKATAPGTYEMTITLTGNCEGTIKQKFVVVSNKDEDLKNIGDVKVDVKIDKNVPKAELENNEAEMIQMVLTADELVAVANGDTANVWLEVNDATNSILADSKKAMEAAAKDYKLGTFIDISLLKKLSSQANATKIHEVGKKIKITITIPEKFLTTDKDINRTFYIVRNHNGEVEIIGGVFDKDAKTFTFETDRFSDYALAYRDNVNEYDSEEEEEQEDAEQGDKTSAQGGKASPQTGDATSMALWIFLLCVSGVALVVTTIYSRKKKQDK